MTTIFLFGSIRPTIARQCEDGMNVAASAADRVPSPQKVPRRLDRILTQAEAQT